MKIKKYINFINETVTYDNVEDLMQKIRDRFNEDEVKSMFDEELASGNWLDDDWEEEHENEYDAYMEQGRGEIEDSIIDQIIKSVDNGTLNNDEIIELSKKIAAEYNLNIH